MALCLSGLRRGHRGQSLEFFDFRIRSHVSSSLLDRQSRGDLAREDIEASLFASLEDEVEGQSFRLRETCYPGGGARLKLEVWIPDCGTRAAEDGPELEAARKTKPSIEVQ